MNENEIIWIASFDIGKCNFAFCVEEINLSLLNLYLASNHHFGKAYYFIT